MSFPLATDAAAKSVADEITKTLLTIRTDWRVWDDFLNAAFAMLDSQMDLVVALREGDEDAFREANHAGGTFEDLQERRSKEEMETLARAYAILSEAAGDAYTDALGNVHMEWQSQTAKKLSGQYFTPHDLCDMMARMAIPEPEDLLLERAPSDAVRDALRRALNADTEAEGMNIFVTAALPHFLTDGAPEPVTIHDPACGSGRFLLAGASRFPRWATQFGLVQVSGQDIDRRCATMARINTRLYGLNGYGARMMAACGQLPLEALSLVAALHEALPKGEASTDAAEQVEETEREPIADDGGQIVLRFPDRARAAV